MHPRSPVREERGHHATRVYETLARRRHSPRRESGSPLTPVGKRFIGNGVYLVLRSRRACALARGSWFAFLLSTSISLPSYQKSSVQISPE